MFRYLSSAVLTLDRERGTLISSFKSGSVRTVRPERHEGRPRSPWSSRGIVLTMCCGAFLTISHAGAQTFGDLRHGEWPRSLTQDAKDPAISRWLMTLPADEDSAERASVDAGVSGQIRDDNPSRG